MTMVAEKVDNGGKVEKAALEALQGIGSVENKDVPLSKVLANAGRGAAEPIKRAEETDYRPPHARGLPNVVEVVRAQSESYKNVAINAEASVSKKHDEIKQKQEEVMRLLTEIRELQKDICNLEMMKQSAELQKVLLDSGVII